MQIHLHCPSVVLKLYLENSVLENVKEARLTINTAQKMEEKLYKGIQFTLQHNIYLECLEPEGTLAKSIFFGHKSPPYDPAQRVRFQ